MSLTDGVWLNKFISESGICSRREADKLIEDGQVTINKEIGIAGDQVFRGDKVRVNGILIKPRKNEEVVFIALNKPVGIVSTSEKVRDNIVSFVNHPTRIFPIGRLDKDSQGLIFLTNDGDMVNKILRAGNNHEKEYMVTVDKPVTDKFINDMAKGVPILGTVTKKCKINKEGVKSFRIKLIQGLNRQIRRMCEFFDYEVVKLERIRIMNVSLKGIPLGEWRDLTEEEMDALYDLTKESTSDFIVEEEKVRGKTKLKFSIDKFEIRETSFDNKTSDKKSSNKKSLPKKKISDKKFDSTEGKLPKEEEIFETKGKKFDKPSAPKSKKPPSGKRIGKSRPPQEKSYKKTYGKPKTAGFSKPGTGKSSDATRKSTGKPSSTSRPGSGRPSASPRPSGSTFKGKKR